MFSKFQNLAISDLLFVLICVPPVSMQYMQAQAGYAWAFDDIGKKKCFWNMLSYLGGNHF